MKYLTFILPAICFAFMLKSAITNHRARRRRLRPVVLHPHSLEAQTSMRAFTLGKPCVGSINDKGEMEFTELEWPEGRKGINL